MCDNCKILYTCETESDNCTCVIIVKYCMHVRRSLIIVRVFQSDNCTGAL